MIRNFRTVLWFSALIIGMVFAPSPVFECEADDATGAVKAERQLPPGAILNLGAPLTDNRNSKDDVGGPSIDYPLAFSPDGAILATGDYPARSWNRSVILWDVKAGKELRRLRVERDELKSLAFSPNGETLAWGSYGNIRLWDVKTSQIRLQLDAPDKTNIRSMCFSADSRRLVTTGGMRIHFWDVATGTEAPRMGPLDARARSVAFSPDGTLVAVASDRSIYVIDSATADVLNREPDNSGRSVSVAFSPDGKRLIAAGSSRLILWKVGMWDEMHIIKSASPSFFHVAFSPAGDLFAVGKSGSLELRGAELGTQILEFKPFRGITDFSSIAFSPDGKTIATSDDRGAVLVWDIAQLRTHYQK
ncbi:MAG: repeat-containing protein [Planctomycetaceae bacterium]|nr:repeat-containing protein [Planctomycetaceae bacterium]